MQSCAELMAKLQFSIKKKHRQQLLKKKKNPEFYNQVVFQQRNVKVMVKVKQSIKFCTSSK